MASDRLLVELMTTAEICGTQLSNAAAKAMALELEHHDARSVTKALGKCRRELTGRLTLAAILSRIAETDGRRGLEEAWANAVRARDERNTVVWTEEEEQAFGVSELIDDGVAARMAFKEALGRLNQAAREEGRAPKYVVSYGHDESGRREPIERAVQAGQLPRSILATLPADDEPRRLLPMPGNDDAFCGPPPELLAEIAKIGRRA